MTHRIVAMTVFIALFIATFSIALPAVAEGKVQPPSGVTSPEDALACFMRALEDVQNHVDPETMMKKYLSLNWLTARAYVHKRFSRWDDLSEASRNVYKAQVQKFIDDYGLYDGIPFDTVIPPRNFKKNGVGQELSGAYYVVDTDTKQTKHLHSYQVWVIAYGPYCLIADAGVDGAWISYNVPLTQ